MTRSINQAGIDLIKQFEGCSLTAYLCPAKIWTIGYGHTGNVAEGMVWTQAQADSQFVFDLENRSAKYVEQSVTSNLSDNQFAALCSLCYNVGAGNFEASTLVKYLNAGNYDGASQQFPRWNKINGIANDGLTRRRAAEQKLFNTED